MDAALETALERLSALRVLVVGDVMLDRFVHGHVDRISPEAPVPVVSVHDEDTRLGGAANVAANVAALGAQVVLAGCIGEGEAGDDLVERVRAEGIAPDGLHRAAGRPTTVKTRIMGGGQQIVRIDREVRRPLDEAETGALLARVEAEGPYDVVIVSDYGKGVITESIMERARGFAQSGVPVVVDPKQADVSLYRGVTCMTPNAREASIAMHDDVVDDASAERVGRGLRERLGADMILLTRGPQGMSLLEDGERVTHIPTEATRVFDVTGAGDTVIATFATFLGTGAAAEDAARWANRAAGIAVRRLGTAAVGIDELRRTLADERR